jgi:outer membrane protein OmpA-like peptidoglycan-associated protein
MASPSTLHGSGKVFLAASIAFTLSACTTTAPTPTTALLDCNDQYTRCGPKVEPLAKPLVAQNEPVVEEQAAETVKTFMVVPPTVSPVLFEFDASTVLSVNLRNVAEFLLQNRDVTLTLHGYTDPIGSEEYNQKLSYQRAAHLKERLQIAGVSNRQIRIEAHGESNLEVAEISAAQAGSKQAQIMLYAPNRRVTFEFTIPSAVAALN